MQITNSALPNDAAALNEAAASGVVVPYNAPTANDFEQVLRSVTPPTPAAATATPAATTTPAGATAVMPGAAPATSAAMPTMATPAPSTVASPYAGAYGMMPAMYVPMMMPMAMMPATGATATTTAAGGAVAATGTPAVAGTAAPMGMPAVAGTPMAMAMVPMAMVPMGMMPLAGMPAAAGTMPTTSGAATTAAASTGSTAGTFRLPFQGTPQITQPFGPTSYTAEPSYDGYSHFHTGIDFALPTGTAVDAAGSGTVVAAGWDNTGFGTRVIVDHGNGVQTIYGHLSKVEVSVGQTIQAGQELGLSGSTGNSSGPHLHFGVEKDGRWVDPTAYLSGSASAPAAIDGAAAPAASVTGSPAAIGGGSASGGATAPASPTSLPALIRQVAGQTGVSASLISAVVQAESAGNPHAVSSAGAKGLMQLMDATAAEFGVTDSFDPQQNVTAGAKYLANLLREFNGNQQLAVAAYNAGPGAVQQYGGIPPYSETQAYVQKVTALQQQYASGDGA